MAGVENDVLLTGVPGDRLPGGVTDCHLAIRVVRVAFDQRAVGGDKGGYVEVGVVDEEVASEECGGGRTGVDVATGHGVEVARVVDQTFGLGLLTRLTILTDFG